MTKSQFERLGWFLDEVMRQRDLGNETAIVSFYFKNGGWVQYPCKSVNYLPESKCIRLSQGDGSETYRIDELGGIGWCKDGSSLPESENVVFLEEEAAMSEFDLSNRDEGVVSIAFNSNVEV